MWHLAACKISVSLSFLKWNDFYGISDELMLRTRDMIKKIFSFLIQLKYEWLTEILQIVRCHIL